MRYLLDADYEKVVRAVEQYLRWKKVPHTVKTYEKPRMTKFRLGFAKSIVVASFRDKTYVKVPSGELVDVIAEFTTAATLGKHRDDVDFEIEHEIFRQKIEGAKKALLLICGLTLMATPVFISRGQLAYPFVLLAFTLVPIKQSFEGMEFYTFPFLYPYYVWRERRLKKRLQKM
ncbi:hypothetical protein [Archaeoglobus veneficus]|uniref:Uncharacterized protein n=1 Tax=Archaeoglobus veneficus (strain DSM 11195 / SNP6) TaxID=693661 RepID=F2KSP1_ARCVS|nr:hypothetical protein [Archaeoglobus veneficus]AEA48111.1 hypothetical protein Arcve_2122 [Archaeoglobus veneficus SNP6]